ncbi:hypothetical protein BDN72DRAFT_773396, partial [Pluteus cervinus]
MTKIVNQLTSKMEIGSPMASLYLLGNPDHYTSHAFKVFYWKSFVIEVSKAWPEEQQEEDTESFLKEKVTLFKKGSKILGLSPVNDYVFRPKELEQLCLYDFVAQCTRVASPDKSKEGNGGRKLKGEKTPFELDLCKSNLEMDNLTVVEDLTETLYPFIKEHPFCKSQMIRLLPSEKHQIPNFVGATLPRKDQGDREYYCKTMLTLFKPWRTGKHLKAVNETWDDAFSNHTFNEHQKQLLKNFHIRYECLDANDDYFAQLRSGGTTMPIGEVMDDSVYDETNYHWDIPEQGELSEEEFLKYLHVLAENEKLNKTYLRQQIVLSLIKAVMSDGEDGTGWSVADSTLLPDDVDITSQPIAFKKSWRDVVAAQRKYVLDQRMKSMAQAMKKSGGIFNLDGNVNTVKIVDKSYLEKKFFSEEYHE